MAWFTQVSDNNIVQQIIYVTDNHNIHWVLQTYGGKWIEVSDNNYPSVGYSYDADNNKFIPPQTYPSWILNNETYLWEAPVTYPDDGKMYIWNESITNWTEVV